MIHIDKNSGILLSANIAELHQPTFNYLVCLMQHFQWM